VPAKSWSFSWRRKIGGEGLRQCVNQLARAIELSAQCDWQWRRIFYVGAGRLAGIGVLDAAEIRQLWRVSRVCFKESLPGRARAAAKSLEGAEDDARSGGRWRG